MSSHELYEGVAVGGPLDSTIVQSRCPKGFVLINAPEQQVWVYDLKTRRSEVSFHAREVDVLDQDKALKAANEPKYDVRAYDDGVIPDDVEVGL